ncbi:VCBS repeat-containing protein, partial [bacterium]|nr:VCBS repeat-containing protein [bacterium]
GKVYAIEHNGSSVPGWPKTTGGPVRGSAVIVDLDDNGYNDVFIASEDGYLYGWDGRGYALPGFPYNLGASSESSPTAGDIDDDGKLEILIGDNNGWVHAINHDGTPLEGWPQRTDFSVKSSPALGDIDTDGYLEIVVGSYDFKVYAWKPNGMLMSGWPVTTEYRIFHSSPTFADVDGDGGVEVVIASGDGHVYAFKEDGRLVPGFPFAATLVDGGSPSAIKGSTTIGDIDGNGYIDILVGAEDGVIYAWETTGIETPGFPWTGMQGFPIRSTPAIGDLDGNGATEIVYGTNFDGKIECIELGAGSYNAANQPWPMFLNNPSHVTLFGHGEVPRVTMDAIEGEQIGDIPITYHIEDRQGDLVDLVVLYTDDSGLYWHYASTTGQVKGLSRSQYDGNVTWHSRDDLDHFEDTDIKIKLMPSDHSGLGRAIESTIIHLDNNDPPRVIFEPLEGEQTEDLFIDYRLEDDENDELSFLAEYSID